jgi:hypothetical protein
MMMYYRDEVVHEEEDRAKDDAENIRGMFSLIQNLQ